MATTFEDDFEDGDIDGWGGNNTAQIDTAAIEGSYSLYVETTTDDGDEPIVTWQDGPELNLDEEFEMRGVFKHIRDSGTSTDIHTRIGIEKDRSTEDENVFLNFNSPKNVTFLATWENEPTPSSTDANAIGNAFDDTWVNFKIRSLEGESLVEAKVWEYGFSEPDTYQMERSYSPVSGKFVVHTGNAPKQFRKANLDRITIDGVATDISDFIYEKDRLVRIGTHTDEFVFGDDATPVQGNGNSQFVFIRDDPISHV